MYKYVIFILALITPSAFAMKLEPYTYKPITPYTPAPIPSYAPAYTPSYAPAPKINVYNNDRHTADAIRDQSISNVLQQYSHPLAKEAARCGYGMDMHNQVVGICRTFAKTKEEISITKFNEKDAAIIKETGDNLAYYCEKGKKGWFTFGVCENWTGKPAKDSRIVQDNEDDEFEF